MMRSKFRMTIFIFILLMAIFPNASGLFFNPDGGFSVGGVQVSVDQDLATISPGETAMFNITIVNESEFPALVHATIVSASQWETCLDPNFVFLEPHTIGSLLLCVTAPEGSESGSQASITIIYTVSFPDSGESIEVPATTIQTVVHKESQQSTMAVLIIATSAGVGLAAFLSTEKGKIAASTLIAPLYTRIHKDNLLKNEIRNGVFTHIRDHPGQSFSEIKRGLELQNGVLSHHLKTLEREHFIKSRKDGLYRRFFLRDQPIPNIMLNDSQKEILSFLLGTPGSTQSEIAVNLGVSRQTVNHHILEMERIGAVQIIRNGRSSICYPKIRPGPSVS